MGGRKLIGLFVVSLMISGTKCFKAQICKATNLPDLIKLSKTDSVQRINRLAAIYFHTLINKYRKENRLDTLAWDEVLWLTARNHNIWMNDNSMLSHVEKLNTKSFTGTGPYERYMFVSNNAGRYRWSGENALYNYHHSGNSILKIAKGMAEYSIQQWKESPGHNANMLSNNHVVHGVAFLIGGGGRVYATDLFASNLLTHSDKTHEMPAREIPVNIPIAKESVKANRKPVRLNLNKFDNDLTNQLYEVFVKAHPQAVTERNKSMEKASDNHSNYMGRVKKLTHQEQKKNAFYFGETPQKRMIKASGVKYFFMKRKGTLNEELVMMEVGTDELNLENLAESIQNQLDKERKPESNKMKVGYGVCLKQSKNSLKIYVTRLSISYKV